MKKHILVKLYAINPGNADLSIADMNKRLWYALQVEYGINDAHWFLPQLEDRGDDNLWKDVCWTFGSKDALALRAAAEEWNMNLVNDVKEAYAAFEAAEGITGKANAALGLKSAAESLVPEKANHRAARFIMLGDNIPVYSYMRPGLMAQVLDSPEDWALLEYES